MWNIVFAREHCFKNKFSNEANPQFSVDCFSIFFCALEFACSMFMVVILIFVTEELHRISRYVYRDIRSDHLYEPKDFQWNPLAVVHVIVPGSIDF